MVYDICRNTKIGENKNMKKRENPYQAVSIPKEALEKIKEHIKNYEYRSIADFIRIAIEDRIVIDTEPGEKLHSTPKMKPTWDNLQKQLIEMKRDIEKLKDRKKTKIF